MVYLSHGEVRSLRVFIEALSDVSARISGGGVVHLSRPIPAGRIVFRVENETDEGTSSSSNACRQA